MYIYIDLVFVINLVMDTALIWAAGIFLKEDIRFRRILLGGVLGALLYVVSLVWLYSHTLLQIPSAIGSMAVSVITAYRPHSFLHLFKLMLAVCVSAFVSAGGFLAVMFMRYNGRGVFEHFSICTLFVLAAVIFIAVKLTKRFVFAAVRDNRSYHNVKLYLNGRTAEVRALADTGNSLRDISGGNEVIICERRTAEKIMPENIALVGDGVELFRRLSDTELCTRIRLIPFKSLGNENGMLLGIRCDMAEADGIKIPNAVMAVYDGTLDSGGLFRAIINYDTLDGRKQA